jgi:hypothetical protein
MRSTITLLAGALALALPAGALAHGVPGGDHGAGRGAGRQDAAASQGVSGTRGRGSVHRHVPMVALIAHGTVVSVDTSTSSAVLQVTRANHHGSGLVGTQVTIDLSKAAIAVADANGDGQVNLADVAVSDQVLLQGRIPLHGTLTGALTATRLIDQTHPASSDALTGAQTTSTD